MPKIKPPTPEELEQIKQHFARRGYGMMSDFTAAKQTDLLRIIRNEPEKLLKIKKE